MPPVRPAFDGLLDDDEDDEVEDEDDVVEAEVDVDEDGELVLVLADGPPVAADVAGAAPASWPLWPPAG